MRERKMMGEKVESARRALHSPLFPTNSPPLQAGDGRLVLWAQLRGQQAQVGRRERLLRKRGVGLAPQRPPRAGHHAPGWRSASGFRGWGVAVRAGVGEGAGREADGGAARDGGRRRRRGAGWEVVGGVSGAAARSGASSTSTTAVAATA